MNEQIIKEPDTANETQPLSEQASASVKRPHYWRDVRETIVSESGPEYEQEFLEIQRKMPIVIETDKDNPFTKSSYASLEKVLSVIRPILNEHGVTIRQFTAAIRGHGDGAKRWFSLPVCSKFTHVETGQYEMIVVDMPVRDDNHSHGAAMTYGKRYGPLSYFGIGTSDSDGMTHFASKVDMEAAEEATRGIVEHIEACKSHDELKAWLDKNEEGLKLLGEVSVGVVREAYGAKLKALKETA